VSRQNGAVPRRHAARSTRRAKPDVRPPNLGSHWRADGAPKTAYRTRSEALSSAEERRRDSGVVLDVYQCDVCSAWHMGNPGGRER